MDIGDETITLFKNELNNVKTVFWNGPMGVYEFSNYQDGTKKLLEYVANNVDTSIVGGGDIVSCARKFGYFDHLTFVSTGGGASLEYLVNKDLPGLVNIVDI